MNAIEQQFNTVYDEHFARLVRWLNWHLPKERVHQSEDFAQEAFIELWAHLGKGRPLLAPFGLLKTIAMRKAMAHQKVKAHQVSTTVDLHDPAAVAIEAAQNHRYAASDPTLAMLAEELEAAMERMRAASDLWRKLHAEAMRAKPRPNDQVAKAEARSARLSEQRDEALVELQEACRVVGELRGELESVGGGSWRSCSGWPAARHCGAARKDGGVNDPTSTHCSNGHLLDSVDRVSFTESGRRVCLACQRESGARTRAKAKVSA